VTVEEHLLSNVHGQAVSLTDDALRSLHDPARIRKIYRLEAPKKGESVTQLPAGAEASIIGTMALKGS
jgi:EKC/KEOPS complex subunit CGI121/TPRKB